MLITPRANTIRSVPLDISRYTAAFHFRRLLPLWWVHWSIKVRISTPIRRRFFPLTLWKPRTLVLVNGNYLVISIYVLPDNALRSCCRLVFTENNSWSFCSTRDMRLSLKLVAASKSTFWLGSTDDLDLRKHRPCGLLTVHGCPDSTFHQMGYVPATIWNTYNKYL